MAPPHHHRSTTKVAHKSFKSRHASKSTIRERAKGRIDQTTSLSTTGLPTAVRKSNQSKANGLTRQVRRNKAKQHRLTAARALSADKSVFQGRNGAPRMVAVVPLSPTGSIDGVSQGDYVVKTLLSAVIGGTDDEVNQAVRTAGAARFVRVDRFGQNVGFVVPDRSLFAVLDACRVADYVLFVISPDEPVDRDGEAMIRAIEAQGVSDVAAAVLPFVDANVSTKERKRVDGSLKSFLSHFFPTLDRLGWLDSVQECSNLVRSLTGSVPRGVRWRDERSWMLVEDIEWPAQVGDIDEAGNGDIVITGVIRGAALNPDRLLQVADWGDFQIAGVQPYPIRPSTRPGPVNGSGTDGSSIETDVVVPTDKRDTLEELAPEQLMDADDDDDDFQGGAGMSVMTTASSKGVLLDDHRYFSDEDEDEPNKVRRLPRGTSEYQSAWYLEDLSDGSDVEDIDYGAAPAPSSSDDDEDEYDVNKANGAGPSSGAGLDNMDARTVRPAMSEMGETEYGDTGTVADPQTDDVAVAAFRAERKAAAAAAAEDAEFPDEIELRPTVIARERLERYRALKSLRTSIWSTDPDRPHEPEEWRRLLDIRNYRAARNRFSKLARGETGRWLEAGIGAGVRVRVQVKGVPIAKAQASAETANGLVTAFGLMAHEHKQTVVNVSVIYPASSPFSDGSAEDANSTDAIHTPGPIKAKSELVIQYGSRRLVVQPVFSQPGKTRNDVHKFERFLHPGQTTIASFVGPLVWGSVPCVVFAPDGAYTASAFASSKRSSSDTPSPSLSNPLTYLCAGSTDSASTSRVIAKRILLTGHPYKIHKRMVTIRYMFFNRSDVTWFKSVPLRTLRGRTGFIKEPLGTHGYFKATFDGPINPLDSIGMSLYKRVWPRRAIKWERGPSTPFSSSSNGGSFIREETRSKGKELADDVMVD